MKARQAVELMVEGKAPKGWTATRGVYANCSNWPHSIDYYVRCPKCGLFQDGFKSLADAHRLRLCQRCSLESNNKLKAEIQKVLHDPQHKPKPMRKLVGEAADEFFDPFDAPLEGNFPQNAPDNPDFSDTKNEIERLLLGNWVDIALRDFAEQENSTLADLEIDRRWSEIHGQYDEHDKESTLIFKVDVGNEEWLFFRDDDEAEKFAIARVRDDLEHSPELFSKDWLRSFIDEDKLRDAIGDPYEDWENEIIDLDYDDLLDKLTEEGYVEDGDDTYYDEYGDHLEETPERYKALESIRDDYVEKEKPKWEPFEWLEDIYGKEQAQVEALKMVNIDVDAAAQDAVRTDGWQHFVATYDGSSKDLDSKDLENGAVCCRIN